MEFPAEVQLALQRADGAGFRHSCDPAVGRLLMVLAAAVPLFGRVLEIGSGAGVGAAWLATGLERRPDVEALSVEADADLVALDRAGGWPERIKLVEADILGVIENLGQFDLIFADAQAGKWHALDRTVRALRPGGLLVVDDMGPPADAGEGRVAGDADHPNAGVRRALCADVRLITADFDLGSGVVLATRRR
ncbi:MAG TPA: class I SAM-dependent methyltransferase [Euzebyales bacterium]|nr:class I SAM-dependent methyltransferase [Euzebyales bacterium]